MSITYTVLNTDGTETALRNPELRDLQAVVGGWLEAIDLRPNETLLVNEDGLSLGLPLNHAATVMFGAPIVGPAVLVVGVGEACGNCRGSLTEDDLCGYGGHDLNELFDESLPESERMRCCGCLADLTGECCCPECSN